MVARFVGENEVQLVLCALRRSDIDLEHFAHAGRPGREHNLFVADLLATLEKKMVPVVRPS